MVNWVVVEVSGCGEGGRGMNKEKFPFEIQGFMPVEATALGVVFNRSDVEGS